MMSEFSEEQLRAIKAAFFQAEDQGWNGFYARLTKPKIQFAKGEWVHTDGVKQVFTDYEERFISDKWQAQPIENMSQEMRDLYEACIHALGNVFGWEERLHKAIKAFEQHHEIDK